MRWPHCHIDLNHNVKLGGHTVTVLENKHWGLALD